MNIQRYDLSYRTQSGKLIQLKDLGHLEVLRVMNSQMYQRSVDFVISEHDYNEQKRDALRAASGPRRKFVGCWTLGDDGSSFPPA